MKHLIAALFAALCLAPAAEASTVTLESGLTTCHDSAGPAADFDCRAVLTMTLQPGQTNQLLGGSGVLSIVRDGQLVRAVGLWTEPSFTGIHLGQDWCSEVCFRYSTDAAGRLLGLAVTLAYTGGMIDAFVGYGDLASAARGNYFDFSWINEFYAAGEWESIEYADLAPVALPASALGLGFGLIALVGLARRRAKAA